MSTDNESVLDLLSEPDTDPTPLFDAFRGHAATELLAVAVHHLRVFEMFGDGPLPWDVLRDRMGLAERPFVVLTVALRALGLLSLEAGAFSLTPLSLTHLRQASRYDVSGYIGLAADSPGVLAMRDRLGSNRPLNSATDEKGAAFIFREGLSSAMEGAAEARALTLALAGRARNVAPSLSRVLPLQDAQVLLDVGGGSGLYALSLLQKHPHLRAIVWDRPAVLTVAAEYAQAAHLQDRLTLAAGDMFVDPIPAADVMLLSNVLHDWDVPECRALISRLAEALPPGGRLVIHDVFLDDDHGGPLPVALYGADLFLLTFGRAYSRAEFASWLDDCGLTVCGFYPTRVHAGALVAIKP